MLVLSSVLAFSFHNKHNQFTWSVLLPPVWLFWSRLFRPWGLIWTRLIGTNLNTISPNSDPWIEVTVTVTIGTVWRSFRCVVPVMRPDTRLTIFSTHTTQCILGVEIPHDIDKSLNDPTTDKIRKYRSDYNNYPSVTVTFIPTVTSTSERLHSEFVRLLFLQTIGKLTTFFQLQEFSSRNLTVDTSTSTVRCSPHRLNRVWVTFSLSITSSKSHTFFF
jgi:hypothetical protein